MSLKCLLLKMVAFFLAITWSPIAAQVKDACELHTRKLEKVYQGLTMRLTLLHLKNGNADSAYDEFKALESQENFTEEMVQFLYADNTVELLKISTFFCKSNLFLPGYTAINALLEQMLKRNQSEQKEIIPLYYKVQFFITDTYFIPQSPGLQNQFHALNSKLSQLKEKIINSIANDIKNRTFDHPNDLMSITESLSLQDAESFQVDVVKQYLASTNTTEFTMLLDFVQNLHSFNEMCIFYGAIWKELQKSDAIETMEALMVWINACEIMYTTKLWSSPCSDIAYGTAPAIKHMLFSNYTDYIKNGQISKIKTLHQTYRMRYFFAKYIWSLNKDELMNNITTLFDAILALPYVADMCFAAASVHAELKYSNMLNTFEHFRTLHIVKIMMNKSEYANLDKVSKTQCESCQEKIPLAFQRLLNGTMSNCSILNRHYDLDPLFCATNNNTVHGHRNIYLGKLLDGDAEKLWSLKVHSAGVILMNHANVTLRYTGPRGNVTGSEYQDVDSQLNFFRLGVKDDDFIVLEPTFENVFLGASKNKCSANSRLTRCVEMMVDANEKRAHWKLVCN